jgi:16S rRNA (uracil1498-N3)-methyltransferase
VSLRLFVDLPLAAGVAVELTPEAVRHVQVRRAQPGDPLLLFDGRGGEWQATVTRMGRQQVTVTPQRHRAVSREARCAVTIALGMPANDRMDFLVEKATELGVAAVQPLHTARSVLRLQGERAERKRSHWQAVAVAASEQCGRTRVPTLAPVQSLEDWLAGLPPVDGGGPHRWLLAPGGPPPALDRAPGPDDRPVDGGPVGLTLLSGPEGGLSDAEAAAATAHGFVPVGLGPRILRADTAPLALLSWLMLQQWSGDSS